MIAQKDIALVRSFNRLVTRQAGALGDRHLGGRPLGANRVLFEIGREGATPRDVRARLGLDSGYLSRIIRALEREGLVEKHPNPADRRSGRLVLTDAGRAEMRELDRLSDELAAAALAPLDADERAQLLRAQADVRRLLAVSMTAVRLEDAGLGRHPLVPRPLLRGARAALRGELRPRPRAAGGRRRVRDRPLQRPARRLRRASRR